MSGATALIGLLTVSDRASRGEYEDRSGPAMRAFLDEVLTSPFEVEARVVPDERERVEALLAELVDELGCSLVLTSGGTGPALRDVTVDATLAIVEKELPGFGERMRQVSVAEVPTAVLSRQTAGIRGACLIVNLPGSPRGVRTCLEAIFAAVPDCVDLIGGPRLETDPERLHAYRPHG